MHITRVSNTLENRDSEYTPAKVPMTIPKIHAVMVDVTNSQIVHGKACKIKWMTGGGKTLREGPKSPVKRSLQKAMYCSKTVHLSPDRSSKVARSDSTASGYMSP